MAYDIERYTSDAVEVIVNSVLTHLRHIMTPQLEERIEKDVITRERFLWLVYGATHCLSGNFNLPEEQAFMATSQVFTRLNGGQPGTALTDASRIRQHLLEAKPITKAMTNVGRQAMEDYFHGEDVYALMKAVRMLEQMK